jgi:hypothetical protein
MDKEWFEDEAKKKVYAMVDTLEDIDKPYREGDSGRVERNVTWPSVEDAKRRINILIEGQTEGPAADMVARDLIVLMRELGRVTAELGEKKMTNIPSESDERTVNNDPNAVRHQYRTLSAVEKRAMTHIKDVGLGLIRAIEANIQEGRETNIAVERVEEAVMWAIKGLTKD